jgi:hypothetical protein
VRRQRVCSPHVQVHHDNQHEISLREECDELRPILARQHQNEVFAERAKQIEIAGIIKEREKEGTLILLF